MFATARRKATHLFLCSLRVYERRNVTKGKHRYSVNLGSSGMTDDAPTTQTVNPPYVHSLRYADDGSVIAAGLGDGSISLHDAVSQDCVARVWPHKKAVGHVEFAAFAPADARNRVLASSSNDGTVLVLDIAQDACKTSSKAAKVKQKGRTAAAASGTTEPWRVLYRIDHGSGPNWMCTSVASGGAVIVADTTPHITVYSGVSEGVHTRFRRDGDAGSSLMAEAASSAMAELK